MMLRTCEKRSLDQGVAAQAISSNRCGACSRLRGCPIGPEFKGGRAYNVAGHSIQMIQTGFADKSRRWMVAVFFSGCRFDLRYPVRFVPTLQAAAWQAFDYARHYCPGATIERWIGEDWIARGRDGCSIVMIAVRR